ncbi:hypothetical protein LTR08_000951 [Meristemomyces frigidus]|nr:hypothetical protein LTR08_000951 [Meristemomyces frigidus]
MENSPFDKLSPELRNEIYAYALTSPHPFVLTRVGDNWQMVRQKAKPVLRQSLALRQPLALRRSLAFPRSMALRRPLALSKTCKAIQHESQQLFYAMNTFELTSPLNKDYSPVSDPRASAASDLRAFRKHIGGNNSAALQSIVVQAGNIYMAAHAMPDQVQGFPLCQYVHDLLPEVKQHPTCIVTVKLVVVGLVPGLTRRWVKFDLVMNTLTAQSWDAFTLTILERKKSSGQLVTMPLPRILTLLDGLEGASRKEEW